MDDGEIIRRHMRHLYDDISAHFDVTRYRPWPEILDFIGNADGEVALDLACGNGRHAPALMDAGFTTICIDLCRPLLRSGVRRVEGMGGSIDFIQGDVVRTPLVDRSADVALFIAGLHHLPTERERVAALKEIERLLAEGGRGLISVWSMDQKSVPADRMALTLDTQWGRVELDGSDRFIPWSADGAVRYRYFHLFDLDEFTSVIERVLPGSVTFQSGDNLFAIVNK
jgi:ubiquinone/menaquinone biosynthesis C-methylase UbiE